MKTIDDFLKDIIQTDHTRATEFVKHLGYDYGQIESYFKRIKKEYPDWLTGHFQECPDGIRDLGYYGEGAKWEIAQFLKNGGFAAEESRENRQKATEAENLKLLKAQRKELMWTRVVAVLGFLATLYFGFKKG